jgi:ligand-binding SRPBCC domain-containing protein
MNSILYIIISLVILFLLSFLQEKKVFKFRAEQEISSDIDSVFDFFSKPENLSKITPPKMGFHILTPTPIEMKAGAIIDYTVKIFGVPQRWRTMITSYEWEKMFVDEQMKGPYSLWHHKHIFIKTSNGVKIIDEVTYVLPLQFMQSLVNKLIIAPQIEEIFSYRKKIIDTKFNNETK